jgi:hypothetical protein
MASGCGKIAPHRARRRPCRRSSLRRPHPRRYEAPLMLFATSPGYSVDPPERNTGPAGADGFQLNTNYGNGLNFSGAIYIDTIQRVRLVVRSYHSNPARGERAINELRAYRIPPTCNTSIRSCAFRADQAWIERDSPGHRLPIQTGPVRSYVPIPQPTANNTVPAIAPLATSLPTQAPAKMCLMM